MADGEGDGTWTPAPYGGACSQCSRAKCKCFYKSDKLDCERCHRLGRNCERAPIQNKRRVRSVTSKLDKKFRSSGVRQSAQLSTSPPVQSFTPSSESTLVNNNAPPMLSNASNPDIIFNETAGMLQLVRPENSSISDSPIKYDVIAHHILPEVSEKHMATFQRAFLSMYPVVHIPLTMKASDLREQKPFLWLVINALAVTQVSEQFAMEEIIWNVISRRIVREGLADIDLLLGVICFAAWSSYFKKDKPFVVMATQIAISLASELGLDRKPSADVVLRSRSGRLATRQLSREGPPTAEECRTMLALFQLSSCAWGAYKKVRPIQWTDYLDYCVWTLEEAKETPLDYLLIVQAKCCVITRPILCPAEADSAAEESQNGQSATLVQDMLSQLVDLRQSLPAHIRLDIMTQLHIYNAEVLAREPMLDKGYGRDQPDRLPSDRLRDLDSILIAVEKWLAMVSDVHTVDWVGMTVELWSQLTHKLMVLFKLTSLEEPGWNREQVKQRADVFKILDNYTQIIDRIPREVGMVDAPGPRCGLFFKSAYLLQAIKALLQIALEDDSSPQATLTCNQDRNPTAVYEAAAELAIPDDFLSTLAEEPWLGDIFGSLWNAE